MISKQMIFRPGSELSSERCLHREESVILNRAGDLVIANWLTVALPLRWGSGGFSDGLVASYEVAEIFW